MDIDNWGGCSSPPTKQQQFLSELEALLNKYQVKIEGWYEEGVAIDGPEIEIRENTLPIPKR